MISPSGTFGTSFRASTDQSTTAIPCAIKLLMSELTIYLSLSFFNKIWWKVPPGLQRWPAIAHVTPDNELLSAQKREQLLVVGPGYLSVYLPPAFHQCCTTGFILFVYLIALWASIVILTSDYFQTLSPSIVLCLGMLILIFLPVLINAVILRVMTFNIWLSGAEVLYSIKNKII